MASVTTMLPNLKAHEGATELSVHLVPRAKKTAVIGVFNGALKVSVAAPPVDGKANQALVHFLAELFGTPKKGVSLIRGDKSKEKTLIIQAPIAEVTAIINSALAALPS